MAEAGDEKMKKLLEPLQIGSIKLKNRMVMSSIVTNYAHSNGSVSDRMLAYYRVRAAGGVSLVIVEAAYVHPTGKAYPNQLGVDDDRLICGLQRLVDTIHGQGAKAFLQLFHAGRETESALTKTPILAPSALPSPRKREMPVELNQEAISTLVNAYRAAALRAKKAGFDGVELQGTHGSLLNQFLSPYSNQRTDEYGGNLTNRMKFPLEVVEKVKEAGGDDWLVSYRLSAYEDVERGLTLEETKPFAQELEKAGVNAVSISAGASEFMMMAAPPMGIPQGFLVNSAAEFKQILKIPVMVAGRINDPQVAEDILERGKTDLIALGRALLADADFPRKVAQEDLASIRMCIACNQECFGRLAEGKDVRCLINAQTGSEETAIIERTDQPKKILVAGGGAAGLEAATVAALRGHDVYLYERTEELGGKLESVAQPPRKGVINRLKDALIYHAKVAGVKIKLNTEVTAEVIDQLKPEAIILTTGSNPNLPPLPGIDQANVCTADDILNKRVEAGKKVVVVGNGLVGAETADWLSELGKSVVLIGKAPEVAPGAEALNKLLMMEALKRKQVQIINDAAIQEILPDGVKFALPGEVKEIHGQDTIVIALGYRPNNQLVQVIQEKGIPVYVAGDCIRARRIAEAIHEAFQVGTSV